MKQSIAVAVAGVVLAAAAAHADEPRRIEATPALVDLLREPVARQDEAPGIIPHGRIAKGMGLVAWFAEPTGRYGHAVLGDAIEAGALVVARDGKTYTHRLPEEHVFEDLEPRIADLDGDGTAEVIAILTRWDDGAGVAIYGIRGGALEERARSDFIGLRHRWRNPAGVADYDGDGRREIAYIETPHIGGKLVLLAWDKAAGRLVEERRKGGWSTHAMGSTVLAMAVTLDWDGDGTADLLLPRQNRRDLSVVSMRNGQYRELARFEHPARIVTALRWTEIGAASAVVYGLANGETWVLTPP